MKWQLMTMKNIDIGDDIDINEVTNYSGNCYWLVMTKPMK